MFEERVAIRLPREDRKKLEALAQRTGRNTSEIVRLLIRLADATGYPDIILKKELDHDDRQ